MPWRPQRPCIHPGCSELTDDGKCEKHKSFDQKQIEESRENSNKRGYGHRWRKARDAYLKEHPLCEICYNVGFIVASNTIDHIKPHKGDPVIFWDVSNWQALCKNCHDSKTAREDGRWGQAAEVYKGRVHKISSNQS